MSYYEIVSTVIAVFSLGVNIIQFSWRKPKIKLQLCWGHEVNKDGVGTYLCAHISISNRGSETAYYSGIKAIDDNGELFYPSCTLNCPSEIPPNASIVGSIPIGHLLSHGTKELIFVDGTLVEHKMKKSILTRVLHDLANEKERLEKMGYFVNPRTL
ncbi:hypothetical protein [Aeromonas veronii]|uniref:hypothetical protein n=1 Tax=Aeromonas veronii TaxID=654 RepID=UPI003D1D447B